MSGAAKSIKLLVDDEAIDVDTVDVEVTRAGFTSTVTVRSVISSPDDELVQLLFDAASGDGDSTDADTATGDGSDTDAAGTDRLSADDAPSGRIPPGLPKCPNCGDNDVLELSVTGGSGYVCQNDGEDCGFFRISE